MKLISLNTWGGKTFEPLINFIKQGSTNTDIFCFQEVFNTTSTTKKSYGYRTNLYSEIIKTLSNHNGYFVSSINNYLVGSFQNHFTKYNLSSGLAIFVRNTYKINSSGNFFIFGKKNSYQLGDFNTMPKNAQYVIFENQGKKFVVCNVHGIWVKEGKRDTTSRIEQSKKIRDFLDLQKGMKILCGDFNLEANTKSIRILETNMINLIRKNNIQTTRSELYIGENKHADYIFVSKDINVADFQLPNITISDHLPMILEFS